MSKRAVRPVKKRPAPRRRSRPPRRPTVRGKIPHRRFRLGAFVARKVEEHARLARDASRIAIALALVAILFLLVGAISRTVLSGSDRRLLPAAATDH